MFFCKKSTQNALVFHQETKNVIWRFSGVKRRGRKRCWGNKRPARMRLSFRFLDNRDDFRRNRVRNCKKLHTLRSAALNCCCPSPSPPEVFLIRRGCNTNPLMPGRRRRHHKQPETKNLSFFPLHSCIEKGGKKEIREQKERKKEPNNVI